jgi:hypothetical protein
MAQPFKPTGGPTTASTSVTRLARAALLQHAQDQHLRRIERDPAQHHFQGAGTVGKEPDHEFRITTKSSSCWPTQPEALPADKDYDFETRKKIVELSADRLQRRGVGHVRRDGPAGPGRSDAYGGFGGGAADLMSVDGMRWAGLVVEPVLPTVTVALSTAPAAKRSRRRSCCPP